MVEFKSVAQIEKRYEFEDAVTKADTFNGAFGTVTDGEFEVAANSAKAIMQSEVGDEAGCDTYPIKKSAHVRVVDFSQFDGETIKIYGDELPDGVALDDKLASNAEGNLETGASAAPYFQVTKIIGNCKGIEATIVAE